jgi:hypothetical protein
VEVAGHEVAPCYVGPQAGDWRAAQARGLQLIEVALPAGLPIGATEVRVHNEHGALSQTVCLTLCKPEPKTPEIVTVRNASDYGTDVQTRGPKAWVMLYVKYLPETAHTKNVWLQVGERLVEPSYVGVDARFGGHQVNLLIPPETPTGTTTLRLLFAGAASPSVPLVLEEPVET